MNLTTVQQGSDPGHVLVVWGDEKGRRALFKILSATGVSVKFATERPQAADLTKRCRLVVMDYDSVRGVAETTLAEMSRMAEPPPVLVITSAADKADLAELFSHTALTNLFAKNTDLLETEMIVTVQKIIRGSLFGFEKYLTWGVQPLEFRMKSSEERHDVFAQLESYLSALGANSRLIGLARGVADEFIMNAVYNAPVDAKGQPKYANVSRMQPVKLLENEEVLFRFACDGRHLALSVADAFGRLERPTVLGYLKKCFQKGSNQIDTKDGGAGLGLYYIFHSLNHFIVNVSPGKRTEMIGLLDISGSFRDHAMNSKSLHLFIERK